MTSVSLVQQSWESSSERKWGPPKESVVPKPSFTLISLRRATASLSRGGEGRDYSRLALLRNRAHHGEEDCSRGSPRHRFS